MFARRDWNAGRFDDQSWLAPTDEYKIDQQVGRLVDNCLRAMRFHHQVSFMTRDAHTVMCWLKSATLAKVRERQKVRCSSDEKERLERLVGLIEGMTDEETPPYANWYEALGVPVPETVGTHAGFMPRRNTKKKYGDEFLLY